GCYGGTQSRQFPAELRPELGCHVDPVRERSAEEENSSPDHRQQGCNQNNGAESGRHIAPLQIAHHRAERKCEKKSQNHWQEEISGKIGGGCCSNKNEDEHPHPDRSQVLIE